MSQIISLMVEKTSDNKQPLISLAEWLYSETTKNSLRSGVSEKQVHTSSEQRKKCLYVEFRGAVKEESLAEKTCLSDVLASHLLLCYSVIGWDVAGQERTFSFLLGLQSRSISCQRCKAYFFWPQSAVCTECMHSNKHSFLTSWHTNKVSFSKKVNWIFWVEVLSKMYATFTR